MRVHVANSLKKCMPVLDEFHENWGVERQQDIFAGTQICYGQFDVDNMADITYMDIRSRIGHIKKLLFVWTP